LLVLFEHSEKRYLEKIKLDAALHGVKLKDEAPAPRTDRGSAAEPARRPPVAGKCIPGDPDSYNHLSAEERQRLTEEMMGRHKVWVKQDNPLGGKAPLDKR
jgi:hypothetical protein